MGAFQVGYIAGVFFLSQVLVTAAVLIVATDVTKGTGLLSAFLSSGSRFKPLATPPACDQSR